MIAIFAGPVFTEQDNADITRALVVAALIILIPLVLTVLGLIKIIRKSRKDKSE